MGNLKYPFVAGAAALMIGGLLLSPRIFPRMEDAVMLAGGLLLGALASVVLYAVMRAIAR